MIYYFNAQNHGLLVASSSIEATIAWYITLEKCCQVQLLIDAAALGRGRQPKVIDDEEAHNVWKTVGPEQKGYFSGLCELSALEAKEGVKFSL